MVTNNPPAADSPLFPKSLTLRDWNLENFDKPYEYYYWSQNFNDLTGKTTPPLSAWQVGNITGKAYSHFGLMETYNGKMLYKSRYYEANEYL